MALAVRAALRAMPVWRTRFRAREDFRSHLLKTSFRALESALFFVESGNKGAAAACVASAINAANAADAVFAADADASAAAFAAATDAASASAAFAAASAADAARAADAAFAADAIWASVSHDASALESGTSPQTLLETPLWPQGAPDWMLQEWEGLKTYLAQFPEENWGVWTEWYEDRLAGRPIDRALQNDRVNIPLEENLWDQPPAVVNARLKHIIEVHQGRALTQDPLGEVFAEADGKIDLDDLADKGAVADDPETREDHANARESLLALLELCSGPSNHLDEMKGRTQETLEALGPVLREIKPKPLVRRLERLKNLRAIDDRRLANPKDAEFPAMTDRERLAFEDALSDLNRLTAADGFLHLQREQYEDRLKQPAPEGAEALGERALADKAATEAAARAVDEGAETQSQGWRRAVGNFLRAGLKLGRRAVKAGEFGAAVARWIVNNEISVILAATWVDPALGVLARQVIGELKKLPLEKP